MNKAELLRVCRLYRGVTQADLEQRTGISRNTICAIENGRGNPTVSTYEKLVNALGFELGVFEMDGTGKVRKWRLP